MPFVAGQRRRAAVGQKAELIRPRQEIKKHVFVVALEGDDPVRVLLFERHQAIDHGKGIRPAVDVVPHEEQQIIAEIDIDAVQQGIELVGAPVNVTYGENTAHIKQVSGVRRQVSGFS